MTKESLDAMNRAGDLGKESSFLFVKQSKYNYPKSCANFTVVSPRALWPHHILSMRPCKQVPRGEGASE